MFHIHFLFHQIQFPSWKNFVANNMVPLFHGIDQHGLCEISNEESHSLLLPQCKRTFLISHLTISWYLSFHVNSRRGGSSPSQSDQMSVEINIINLHLATLGTLFLAFCPLETKVIFLLLIRLQQHSLNLNIFRLRLL